VRCAEKRVSHRIRKIRDEESLFSLSPLKDFNRASPLPCATILIEDGSTVAQGHGTDCTSFTPELPCEGLPKQDKETLRETREYIDELLEAREQRRKELVTEDELLDEAQLLEAESSGVVYLEYRTCGDESCSCMSGGEKLGPYKYRAYRDGDTVRRDYLGKATVTYYRSSCLVVATLYSAEW
jgi:hypothetical protein